MPRIHGPNGSVDVSDECAQAYRRMHAAFQYEVSSFPPGRWQPSCALEEIVDGGHDVLHEMLQCGLVLLNVWTPGVWNGEGRAN